MNNKENFMINISMWLNNFMNKKNIDVKELSEKMECSESFINRILDYEKGFGKEEGQFNLSIEFIVKMADVCGVYVNEILEYEGSTKQNEISEEMNDIAEQLLKLNFDELTKFSALLSNKYIEKENCSKEQFMKVLSKNINEFTSK